LNNGLQNIVRSVKLNLPAVYAAVSVEPGLVCWPHQRPELCFPLFVCRAFGR